MFRYYNANPELNDVEDCTIRAISVAEGISWDEAYIKLSKYARMQGLMISSVTSIERYLDDNYERILTYDEYVGEFAKDYTKGTYLITMKGHITVLKNGIIYDTFDPSKRMIWDVWKVK